MGAYYSRYTTAKNFSGLDLPWKNEVWKDIKNGSFKKFTSANASAKQHIIYLIDKAGKVPKVEALGCSVHRITIGDSDAS